MNTYITLKQYKLLIYTFIFILLASSQIAYRTNIIKRLYDSYNWSNKNFKVIDYNNTCKILTGKITNFLRNDVNKWSISLLDDKGRQLLNINGEKAMIPASNMKLFTTAYLLDKISPDNTLETTLSIANDGSYHLNGEGDPDLNKDKLDRIVKSIYRNIESNDTTKTTYKLYINNTNKENYWPATWSSADKLEYYGAPITKLAVNSNASPYALTYPTDNVVLTIKSILDVNKPKISIIKSNQNINNKYAKVIHKENSSSFLALLSLANSESHNYTSEVLLRTAANNWSNNLATLALSNWISDKQIPMKGIYISDGSGLSRKNLLTTNSLTTLLFRMSKHPRFNYYKSSMAVAGIRGTLSDIEFDSYNSSIFWGKTGTLNGVRSISGIVSSENYNQYLSIISYDVNDTDLKIKMILDKISHSKLCL